MFVNVSNITAKLLNILQKRKFLSAYILGVLTFLAFAPYHFWPIYMAIIPCLFHLINKEPKASKYFWLGTFFCAGIVTVNFFWGMNLTQHYFHAMIDNDMYVYIASITAMFLFFLPTFIFYGVAFSAYSYIKRVTPKFSHVWLFGALLLLCEIAFGLPYENQFPWLRSGYSLAGNVTLSQIAAIGSVSALSVLLIMSAALMARPSKINLLIILCAFISTITFGTVRLSNVDLQYSDTNPVRLVQASLPVTNNLSVKTKMRSVNQYIMLSQDPSPHEEYLTIWPEAAVPYAINEESAIIQQMMGRASPEILTGTVASEGDIDNPMRKIYNASALIHSAKGLTNITHKTKLVPYAEYWPLGNFLPRISRIVLGNRIQFHAGETSPVIASQTLGNILVLNCYEIIFPEIIKSHAKESDVIINISNDAWFENTLAEDHLLAISRIRAIEAGLPLIRATNKGANILYDGYGRLLFYKRSEFPGTQDILVPNKTESIKYIENQ